MRILYFAVATYLALSTLLAIAKVGKPRGPRTGLEAVETTVVLAAAIWLLIIAGNAR